MLKKSKARSITSLASPCPNCGSDQLTPGAEGTALCLGCRRCWRVEAGLVRWVSPARCAGCGLRSLCADPVVGDDAVTVLSVRVRQLPRLWCVRPPRTVTLDVLEPLLPPGA